jgi:hypothetical protein
VRRGTHKAIIHHTRGGSVANLGGSPERRDVHARGGDSSARPRLGTDVIQRVARGPEDAEPAEVLPRHERVRVDTPVEGEGDYRTGVGPTHPARPVAAEPTRRAFIGLKWVEQGAEALRGSQD